MVAVARIELTSSGHEPDMLPLHYTAVRTHGANEKERKYKQEIKKHVYISMCSGRSDTI